MHYREKIAGAFPISCEVMIQCEPDAFNDEALRAAQRSVPLAIVHGKNDPNVDFSGARYAAGLFGENGWPGLLLFTSDTAGHMFMRLPVGEAIRWLEAMTSDDPEVLVGFAEKQAEAGRYRDATAALRRLAGLKRADAQKQRADRLRASIDARAKAKADELLPEQKRSGSPGRASRIRAMPGIRRSSTRVLRLTAVPQRQGAAPGAEEIAPGGRGGLAPAV